MYKYIPSLPDNRCRNCECASGVTAGVWYIMAACSPVVPSRGEPRRLPQIPVDAKAAKRAIAKAARALRTLLTDRKERIEVLVKQGLLKDNDTKDVVKELKENIGNCPRLFDVLLREVRNFPDGVEAAGILTSSTCPTSPPDPKPQTCHNGAVQALEELKKKLVILKTMNPKDEIIKTTIVEAVEKELKKLGSAESIKDELSRMNSQKVISPEIFDWAIAKTDEMYKHMLATIKIDDETILMHCTPVELDKHNLYHASICSAIVNETSDKELCIKQFQSLSRRSLKKFAVTQPDSKLPSFPKCMITVCSSSSGSTETTTCYIAFKDFQFRELSRCMNKSTFGEAFEWQIEKFPVVFLENAMKKFNRLVLTGFSFGGVLAQMLTAKLWLLPQTKTEKLLSNVICITFGQPLIQSDLLTHVVEIYPDFMNNVHAIGSEDDCFPVTMEKLDSLTSTKQVSLPIVMESLSLLQDYYFNQRPAATHVNSVVMNEQLVPLVAQGIPSFSGNTNANTGTVVSRDASNPKILAVQSEVEKILQSQRTESDLDESTNVAAERHLIVHDKSGMKLVQMNKSLLSLKFKLKAHLISQETFDRHSTDIYYLSAKKLTFDDEMHNTTGIELSNEFLCPSIEQVKITQYGNDAIVVVTGRQLWFVHSMKLSSVLKEPFQVQEASVSFKTNMENIDTAINQEKKEIVVFSHFNLPTRRKLCVEFDANTLTPRGRQLATLEPGCLLEFGLMISLLERCPNLSVCSDRSTVQTSEAPPFLNQFKQCLHNIAAVVPFESLLSTLAQCNDVTTICERYVDLIRKLSLEFPFSLSMYASLFVAIFKIQHQKSIDSDVLNQLPFEDCAYFMWLKAKHTKGTSLNSAVNSFSEELFTDPYIFGSEELFCEDALYLRKMVQNSLKQVNSLSEVEATSHLSAADLYKSKREKAGEAAKQETKGLKSPVSVLLKGREALQQANDISTPHLYEEIVSKCGSYDDAMKVLYRTRGIHFDFCIRVLCDFMYQHVQVPFTEVNPMTNWKCLCHHIAPYSDILKSDSKFWASMLTRCQRATSKGSQVAERTYNDKLKFLVNNIDPGSKAHTAPTSSEYMMYTLEKKLKELCSSRKILKDISIDRMAREWQSYFHNCPMLNVARSHRTLIGRWIKWSLLMHELRITLENHVTIAVTGLVNSGKTQLIKSLFGFQVKAGTVESRRTIIPFMYSLAPEVEGVHVIDLPGADDSDKNVLQLTEFLKSISQVVVFVVSHEKANSKDAVKWLNIYEKRSEISYEQGNPNNSFASISLRNDGADVPVLVCMTFADKVLAELLDDDGKYNKEKAKIDVTKHFEEISTTCYSQSIWKPHGRRTIGCYCLDLSRSTLCESDMRAVDIRVPSDIGDWLCKQLREELHACDTANQLEVYFKSHCSKLK